MSKSRIFEWIRAAATADMSAGCAQFCLQLITVVDSKTLKTSLTVYQVSKRVTAQESTVKKYRRELKEMGLLGKGRGWILTVEGEPLHSVHRDTQGVHTAPVTSDQCPQVYPKVYPQQPSIHYRSTSFSTSEIDERTPPGDLSKLRPYLRPNIGKRSPDMETDLHWWFNEWRNFKGSEFPWSVWAECVLPYLSRDEQDELLGIMLSTDNPNLRFAKSVVERMCRGEAAPHKKRRSTQPNNPCRVPVVVPGRSEDDDAWLEAISR